MLISVVSDGSELSNYAVVKILNSASKRWDASVLVLLITGNTESGLDGAKRKIEAKATELNLDVTFTDIPQVDIKNLAKTINKKAVQKGTTGLFIPDVMSDLSDELKRISNEFPIEEVSSDLFPSVWDLMTKRVATVNIQDTLKYAAEIMLEKRIGSLIVMDRGRVAGMLTEHDFVKAYNMGEKDSVKVRDVMSHPVIKLDRSGNIFEACELMKRHGIKKLVIMDGEELQGILTTTDLARLPLSISDGLNFLVTRIKELSL